MSFDSGSNIEFVNEFWLILTCGFRNESPRNGSKW